MNELYRIACKHFGTSDITEEMFEDMLDDMCGRVFEYTDESGRRSKKVLISTGPRPRIYQFVDVGAVKRS